MKSSKILATFVLLALVGVTACNDEPETEPAPPAEQAMPQQEMDPATMELMMEAQEIQQQLAPIQQEAMQDEALSNQLEDLQARIETAIQEEDPELFDQMDQFEAEFVAAQEAGDTTRAQEIAMEAQAAQMEIQALQQSVLERPEIREPIEEFEDAQRARMIEIDPEAGVLMDRLEEIVAEAGMQ